MIILYYFFYASLSKCFALAQDETNLSFMKDSAFIWDLSWNVFYRTESDFPDKVIVMRECLIARIEENITDIDSISNCTATVMESVNEVMNSRKEYRLGIKYPGKSQESQA